MDTSLVVVLVFACVYTGEAASKVPISNQLHKDLLKGYQRDVIPIFNKGEPIEVNFGISLQQIIDVDTHNSKFVAQIWLNYGWKDERLTWNVSSYNGVNSLRIREQDIWMPDIRMYNSLAHERTFDTHVVVYNDGTCSYVPVAQVTGSCTYDLKWFPFDTQWCVMKFGSWTYDGTKVNLTAMNREIDISTYQPNGGWDLISVPAKRSVQIYACCPEPYIDITFSVEIKRRGSKSAWAYICPAVMLSFLIPVLFLLPSDSSARFALGGGMLVAIMFLLYMLHYPLPDELIARPMLGLYYDMMFFLVSLAMALSAAIASLASKSAGPSPPPGILKTVLLNGLGRICCVSFDRKYGAPTGSEMDSDSIVKSDAQTSAVKSAAYEWRLIAKVLDRLLLLIFFIVVVVGSLAILPK